jgi:DNA-binding transcriptional MerR regulator
VAQYRITELAQVSGVNERNIRAYRERGLLDPPRRVGRMAIYDDAHLAQLRVIDQLLNRGFTSAHICDFFAAVRSGRDLADVLGLHDALVAQEDAGSPNVVPLDTEVSAAEARRMVDAGLACVHGGDLVLCDPDLVRIVSRAPDSRQCLAVLVEVFSSCQPGVAAAAQDVDALLKALGTLKTAGSPPQHYRELAAIVIARQVGEAVRRPVMRSTA